MQVKQCRAIGRRKKVRRERPWGTLGWPDFVQQFTIGCSCSKNMTKAFCPGQGHHNNRNYPMTLYSVTGQEHCKSSEQCLERSSQAGQLVSTDGLRVFT